MGHAWMSFLDAYRGYHQIEMHEFDQEKTAFNTPHGIFYYKVIPFELKNTRAIYYRMITKMFKLIMGRPMDAYINDMMVKIKKEPDHLRDLTEVFAILTRNKLSLNAAKCAFGISSVKFVGHLVTRLYIKVNPEQIIAINDLVIPKTAKEVQKLTRMAVTLN